MMLHGVHGKLTGAGGEGGCVIGFYVPSSDLDLSPLTSELERSGYSVDSDIKLSIEGLRQIKY